MNKVDQLDFNRNHGDIFRNAVAENKKTVIDEIKRLGGFGNDFIIESRQAVAGVGAALVR